MPTGDEEHLPERPDCELGETPSAPPVQRVSENGSAPVLACGSIPSHARRGIGWLIVAHIAVGAVGACLTGDSPTLPGAAFIGIVMGQACLIGIWDGLGLTPWWRRAIGAAVGVTYLFVLLGFGVAELNLEVFLVVALTAALAAMPLLIARFFFRIVACADSLPVAGMGRIQFSIRDLMILTFVVACLATVGKWLQPQLPHGDTLFSLLQFCISFGVVGVLPVWLVLATKRPVLFSIGLVPAGAFAGYCLARLTNDRVSVWVTAVAAEALVVAASLLVIRSCGYRLMRGRGKSPIAGA